MVTVKISGDLGPETVCCCACTWTDVSLGDKIQRNCKGLKINVYMRSWGKLWTRYTETRNPSATSEEPGAKAGYCACPLHSTSSRRWADHLSHPSSPYPVSGTSSFPAQPLSELNKQESLFVLAPPAAAGAQIKPCLNYFYWLRRPRPLINITVTGRKGPEAEGQTPWSVGEKPSSS